MSNLQQTYRKHSLVATDDLLRFWRLKVKVTTGRGEGIASMLGVLVHLLVDLVTVDVFTYDLDLPP